MNRRPFTYAVLQYVHDPVAGEAMKIGVLVFSAEAKYLSSTFEYRYERLSNAFSDFDGDGFKRTLREFDQAVDRFQPELCGSPLAPAKLPLDAGQVAKRLWPNQGLSFRSTAPRSGLSRDLAATTADLFSRFVSSQNEGSCECRGRCLTPRSKKRRPHRSRPRTPEFCGPENNPSTTVFCGLGTTQGATVFFWTWGNQRGYRSVNLIARGALHFL